MYLLMQRTRTGNLKTTKCQSVTFQPIESLPFFHLAKYNLGKVNLEPMQSAVAPICVRDLRGDPLQLAARLMVCRRFMSHFS